MANRARAAEERGQGTVEMIAALPALLLAGLVALQLFAALYAQTMADGAAEAGALALAAGRPAESAVRQALPRWNRDEVAVDVQGARVSVRIPAPSPIAALRSALAVSSSAEARRPK